MSAVNSLNNQLLWAQNTNRQYNIINLGIYTEKCRVEKQQSTELGKVLALLHIAS